MAKSLKSKSKRQFRKIKREDPKSAFHIAEQLRLSRLSAKLKQSALKPKALTDAEEYRRQQEGYETDEEEEEDPQVMEDDDQQEGTSKSGAEGVQGEGEGAQAMQTDPAPAPKVSTSGPRMSRRETYRTDKKFQIRLTPKTHFRSRGEGKRMGCKPHRRR